MSKRYTVTVTDDNGTTTTMVLTGDREEVETLVAYANANPTNLYRTYTLAAK